VATYRLWPATSGAVTDSANAPISLGTEITLSATGWVTALHMWRATLSEVGPVTGAVYNVATGVQVPGTAVTYTLSGTGWQTVTLGAPVQLSASTRYIVVVHHTDRYAGTASYWTSGPGAAGITNGILTAPPNSAVVSAPVGQGRYTEAAGIQAPTSTFSGGGYWADLSVTDINPGGTDHAATPGEQLGLTDTVARALDAARSTGDLLGIVDQVATTTDAARAATETLGLTDQVAAALDRTTTAGDPLGLLDSITTTTDAAREPAETLGLVDAAVVSLDTARPAADTLGLTDTVVAVLGRALTITVIDALGMTDTAAGAGSQPGTAHHIRVGPPRTTWTIGPPTT